MSLGIGEGAKEMTLTVMDKMLDRNLDSLPPSERHLATGSHLAKLIKRTRGGRWRLHSGLASLLDVESVATYPTDKYGLEILANPSTMNHHINRYLENKGIAVDEQDLYTATEVVIDIRQALVNGEEGTIPIR